MPRDINALRENLRNAQNTLDQLRATNRALADDPNATFEQIENALNAVRTQDARVRAIQSDLQAEEAARSGAMDRQPGRQQADDEHPRLRQLLSSREYARAFADAMRSGVTMRAARGNERYNVLFDALTEIGGTPEGANGGFLVPEDIDLTIRETRRQLVTLADLFDVESVSTNKGQRTKDAAPTAGFTALDGEIPLDEDGNGAIPMDDQPAFSRVSYALTTYGLNIPISNELIADEAANLFGYLGRFFARKQVITENRLLLALLAALTPITYDRTTEDTINGTNKIKQILNKVLDPDISANAVILTNQTGFDYMDQLEDKMGRPLLQPDPTTGTPMAFKNKRVVMVSDAMMPNDTTGGYMPFYIGDFHQYGTLFVRQPLEMASTDVGGNAWRSYSTEVRGITRLDARVFDGAAAANLKVSLTASEG